MNEQAWRDGVISTAKEFADVLWIPSEKNLFHGYDRNHILVNTPDIGYKSEKFQCGWWKVGEENRRMPYNWGGCCTVEGFITAIANGKYAGNVPDSRDNGTGWDCTGVDCSGLVTVCWGLAKKQSTKTLADLAVKLDSTDLLLPGDVLLLPGSHVMIFIEFTDFSKTAVTIIDSTRGTGKVSERTENLQALLGKGYAGYRMKLDE